MLNPVTIHEVATARRNDVLREAEQYRLAALARQARAGQPGLTDRLLDALADLMIEAGEGLRERHASHSPGELG